ncbi:MAG: reverse transcriptase domain-containing protein [Candidatus Karelsulcia muelleri]
MNRYLTDNSVLSKSQFGFVPGRSTIHLLDIITNSINEALHENIFVIAVCMDLSKAFDVIDYKIMFDKLRSIGIGGNLLALFKNYFKDRKIIMTVGTNVSDSEDQVYGLIQGSIQYCHRPYIIFMYVICRH